MMPEETITTNPAIAEADVNQSLSDEQINAAKTALKNTRVIDPVVQATDLTEPKSSLTLKQPVTATSGTEFVDGLTPIVERSFQQYTDQQSEFQKNLERQREQRSDVLNRLLSNEGTSSQDVYQDTFGEEIEGITGQSSPEFMKTLADANLTLAQLQGKYRSKAQAVSGARGQSQVFESAQLSEVDRQKAVEVGNQALIVQALQGNYDTARQIALDTAQFATEDRKAELTNLLNQFDALDGLVTGEEQKQLEAEKAIVEAEIADLERTQHLVDTAILTGLVELDEIQVLTSTEATPEQKQALALEIINRGGGADREFEREKAFFDKDDNNISTVTPIVDADSVIERSNNPEQTQSVLDSIRNSSGKKGRLTQSQEEDIITVESVISQLGTIIDLASGGDLPKESSEDLFGVKTGQIKGRISKLKGTLGSNPNAAALNAAITGLIPKVARGVFGEVGVLTDQDVSRYEKTVPNMFLPENSNEAVTIVLLDSLANAIGSKLNVWSKSRDVSEFENIYLNVLKESQDLKDKINGVVEVNSLEDYYKLSPENAQKVEQLINDHPELEEDELFQILGLNRAGIEEDEAQKVARAIMTVESGGRQLQGASGEFGAFQFMPATWEIISKEMTGKVLPQTPENEFKVAESKIAKLLETYTPEEVALIWNTSLGGAEKPFKRKGVNSKGVKYDSTAYSQKVLRELNRLT